VGVFCLVLLNRVMITWQQFLLEKDEDEDDVGLPRTKEEADADYYLDSIMNRLRSKKILLSLISIRQEAEKFQMPDDRTYWQVIQQGRAIERNPDLSWLLS